jgi:hypothetical protein
VRWYPENKREILHFLIFSSWIPEEVLPQNPNIGVPRRTYTTFQTDAAPFSLFSRTTNVRVVPGAGHGHVGCSRCHARPGLVWDRRYPGHGHDARMTPTQTSPGPVRHPRVHACSHVGRMYACVQGWVGHIPRMRAPGAPSHARHGGGLANRVGVFVGKKMGHVVWEKLWWDSTGGGRGLGRTRSRHKEHEA